MMLTAAWVIGAAILWLAVMIIALAWLKARSARILDDEHARHD
jgi:uncharacterized SAM-binding protein YcdF (DUF218 family)